MKLSLHLGLNRVDPAAYGGWPGLLNACENDATGLATALTARGFNARLLLNENCTLSAFNTQLSTLAATAKPGDFVIVSFSGHGGQQYSLTEPDGYNETLCFFDGQLVDDDFVRLLGQFAPGVDVVVILDCCHAGGNDREVPASFYLGHGWHPSLRCAPDSTWLHRNGRADLPVGQSAPPRNPVRANECLTLDARQRVPTAAQHTGTTASIALFCACQEDETASDGDKFGAWTGSLLNALAGCPPGFLIQSWFTLAAAQCPHGQHPVLHPLGETGVLNQSIA